MAALKSSMIQVLVDYSPVGDDELRMLDDITEKENKRSHLLTIFQADTTLLDRNFIHPPWSCRSVKYDRSRLRWGHASDCY